MADQTRRQGSTSVPSTPLPAESGDRPMTGTQDGLRIFHRQRRSVPPMYRPAARRVIAATAVLAGWSGIVEGVDRAGAQQPVPASFTSEQMTAGAELYRSTCSSCHLESLAGSFEAPELSGPNFRNQWGSRPISALLLEIRETMPPQAPSSLSEDEVAAIGAYILSQNGAPAGATPLAFESPAVLIASADPAPAEPLEPPVYPIPGRPGNTPTPGGRAVGSAPEPPGEVHETPTALVRTIRPATGLTPVSDRDLEFPPAEDWLHWRGNPSSWGYTPLDQITANNVGDLELAWVWPMHSGTNNQAPLVRSGVLYLINAWNIVQALDARDGTLLWEYERRFPDGRQTGGFGLGAQTRTIALWGDMVYVATRDAYLVALDAATGEVRWEVEIADGSKGYTNAHGPIAANGRIINGINGCDRYEADSCFITAHDARTGEELWRTFTIARPGEPGGDTWGDLPWEFRAGGDVWNGASWDPLLGFVYFGVAQAKPWVPASRGLTTADSALYTNATLALDVQTGEIAWYRQHNPGEALDLDEAYEQVLVDVGPQPVVLTIGKPGVLWKLDRRDGRFLGVAETVFQNVVTIDYETGAVQYRDDIQNAEVGDWLSVCPSTAGGKNWHSSGYHPDSGLLILPLAQTCMEISGREVERALGSGGTAADRMFYMSPEADSIAKLAAYDVDTLEEVWSVQQEAAFNSGILTTAGGLAFVGDFDRWVRGYDVQTGEVLWSSRLGGPVMGFPIAFEVDGVQHLAFSTTQGGGSPWQFPSLWTPELATPNGHNALYVFRLRSR
ncbi:MAG: PQQ-binding-like beta-propeller repeat protein [Gemmatimonas sp.]|nr:PQQ-binding-like beta-propeller repeat protein [Gemmatimonas sp.]